MKAKMIKCRAFRNLMILVPMLFSFLLVAILFLFGAVISVCAEGRNQSTKDGTEFVSGVLMVKFAESANVEVEKNEGGVTTGIHSIDVLSKEYGVRKFMKVFSPEPKSEKAKTAYGELGLGRIYRFETDSKANVQAMVAEYAANPNVEYAEPDYIGHGHFIPNDPNFSVQWGLYNTGLNPPGHPGTVDADVDATEAWVWWVPEHVIILAILDTGVDYDHPDFWKSYPNDGVILRRTAECSGIAGIDDDGNGYVGMTVGDLIL